MPLEHDPRFDPLRVRLESQAPVSVSVDAVRRGAAWDPFRTQIEKDPPQRVPGIGSALTCHTFASGAVRIGKSFA